MSWRIGCGCCTVVNIVPSGGHVSYHWDCSLWMASDADRGALDRSLAEAELLNDITVAAAGEGDLGRLLDAVLARLRGLVAFTGGSIALVEGEKLVVRAAVGPFAGEALGQRLERGPSRAWRVVETGQTFCSDDLG